MYSDGLKYSKCMWSPFEALQAIDMAKTQKFSPRSDSPGICLFFELLQLKVNIVSSLSWFYSLPATLCRVRNRVSRGM